jgi:hypothetical protein
VPVKPINYLALLCPENDSDKPRGHGDRMSPSEVGERALVVDVAEPEAEAPDRSQPEL